MSAISLETSRFLSIKENREANTHLLKTLKHKHIELRKYIEILKHKLTINNKNVEGIQSKITLFENKISEIEEKIAQVQSRILKTGKPTQLPITSKLINKDYRKLKSLIKKINTMKKVSSALEKLSDKEVRKATGLLKKLPKDVLFVLGKDVHAYHPSKHKPELTKPYSWGHKTLSNQPRLAVTLNNDQNLPLLKNCIQKVQHDMNALKKTLVKHFKEKAEAFSKKVLTGKFSHDTLEKLFESLEPEVQELVSHKPPYYGSGISLAAKQHETLGAHIQPDGSVSFNVFAPNAKKVVLTVTSYENDELEEPIQIFMKKQPANGVWSTSVENLPEGCHYYYQLYTKKTEAGEPIVLNKVDPYGFGISKKPTSAEIFYQSTVCKRPHDYQWKDETWMVKRKKEVTKPINIYEFQPVLWKKNEQDQPLNWHQLGPEIVKHCKDYGFTHIELMGALDYPADKEMGCYQVLSFFASNHRLGTIVEMQQFIDLLHQNNIGVFIDWTPTHFCIDSIGLEQFDGSQLYEHRNLIQEDDDLYPIHFEKNGGETPILEKSRHPDWNTWKFDFSRESTRNFLYSSADFWLAVMHIDGIRVDAVTSMFILNYSNFKKNIQCLPSIHNDFLDYEAMDFIRNLNAYINKKHHGVQLFAEESSGFFPGITQSVDSIATDNRRGYGFDMFWNMGWMNNTLDGFKENNFNKIIHGFRIARTSRTIYEISHDEVAYEKGSILNKMSGDRNEQFAKSRNLLAYQMCLPGAKLSMMGNEFAQSRPWTAYGEEHIKQATRLHHLNTFLDAFNKSKNRTQAFQKLSLEDRIHIVGSKSSANKKVVEWSKVGKPDVQQRARQLIDSVSKTLPPGTPVGVLWDDMKNPQHKGVAKMMKTLGNLYLEKDALWSRNGKNDATMDEHIDNKCQVLAYRRKGSDPTKAVLCAHNFGSATLKNYRIPYPKNGFSAGLRQIREIFNSDDNQWGGKERKNEKIAIIHNEKQTYIEITLPPNSTIIFEELST